MKSVEQKYSRIVIIYNPNSTSGMAETRGRRLKQRLEKRGVKNIDLIPTEHAGHAEEIAYQTASRYAHSLLISVSGDGGYNEVINGAIAADKKTGHHTVCTILAAGNANDHRRSLKKMPMYKAVIKAPVESMDILKMTVRKGDRTFTRFAHSYIGLGFTSDVAKMLNQTKLTRRKEIEIGFKAFFNFEPLRIQFENDRVRKLDGIVFANIHQMSKAVRIGKKTGLRNGKFKVGIHPHRSRFKLLFTIILVFVFGVRKPPEYSTFSFTLPKNSLIHLDGEVHKLAAGSKVTIESASSALDTIR